MTSDVPDRAGPYCAVHPEVPAGGACQRCGDFVCPRCATWVLGALYCADCAVRPEVNYLEAFQRGLWGRRDGWAYCVAGGSVLLVGAALWSLLRGAWGPGLLLLLPVPVGVGFFLGRAWARVALPFAPLAVGLLSLPWYGAGPLSLALIPFGLALSIFFDTRNQLFFRQEVSDGALRRLWNLHANNPIARHAASLGVSALFLPLLAPLAIGLGIVGLRRVDPEARPPMGRRGQALAGIVLGVLAVLFWALVMGPTPFQGVLESLLPDD